MLYLAEVQKKQQFIGGYKADLKLLACQRNDQSWSAIPGEELVPAPSEEINNLNHAQIVLVELAGNKQVQRILNDTGRALVSKLETFSRQLEKSKKDEAEIDQWKQSLSYQSQELNRREMELEAKLEQLANVEEDLERLEKQRQEIERTQAETSRLHEEYERGRQEMEGAWEQLRGEQRRLEERMADFNKESAVLDEQQAARIQELINNLSETSPPTDGMREELTLTWEIINNQHTTLENYQQQWQQHQNNAQQLSAEVERQRQDFQQRHQEFQQAKTALEEAKIDLKVQQNTLDIKQYALNILNLQIQNQQELYDQIYGILHGTSDTNSSQKVDIKVLENMPLGELQEMVDNLAKELEKMISFVNLQEEELTEKRQVIEDLQTQIQQANEYDRIALETELAEEQDGYQFLDQTLRPQRRNLREREEFMQIHQRVLRQRQGIAEPDQTDQQIAFENILMQLELQKQQQQGELQQLETEIQEMRQHIQQIEEMIVIQSHTHDSQQQELASLEQNLQVSQLKVSELSGKVALYQEILPSVQDASVVFKQKLEAMTNILNQIQETGNTQQQAIMEMQQTFNSLI